MEPESREETMIADTQGASSRTRWEDHPFVRVAVKVLVFLALWVICYLGVGWIALNALTSVFGKLDSQNAGYFIIAVIVISLGLALRITMFFTSYKQTQDNLQQAEQRAFGTGPQARQQGSGVAKKTHDPLSLALLAQLYTEQIKKYQVQTQVRAICSFFFAIVAMASSLAFLTWGGWYLVSSNNITAGATLAGIGGAVSAFLSATFLWMHKLSVEQLHIYFQQPVINDHVVNAQRLAELMSDKDKRDALYERIADKLLTRVEKLAEKDAKGKDKGE